MEPTATQEPVLSPAPEVSPAPTQIQTNVSPAESNDPFVLDDSVFANVPPEGRAVLEPVLKQWKERATETLKKDTESRAELDKRAKAFDQLVGDQRFQQWYQGLNAPQSPPQPAAPPQNPIPTPEEWAQAANDPKKWSELQVRHTKAVLENEFGGKIKEFDQKQKDLELSMEFDQALRKHKDWDVWQYDKDDVGLLEPLLYYHKDRNGSSIEDAFSHIKKVEDFFRKKFVSEQNAQIQKQKNGVVEAPVQTSGNTDSVEYADNPQDLLRKQITAGLRGRNVQVVLRKK